MIPFGSETVTLYARTEQRDAEGRTHTLWRRAVLTGCSWREKTEHTLSEGALVRTQTTVCRIPADQMKPAPGDLLILGAADADALNAVEIARLRETLQRAGLPAFRVQTVADNSRSNVLPHYAAEGA